MIQTPRMWELDQRIQSLKQWHKSDPKDYMVQFELEELVQEYVKLERREKIGLTVVQGGKTDNKIAYRLNKHLILIHDSDLEAS